MKSKDCKAIRQVIEEAELGQEPNSLTKTHLRQCAACLEFFESENKLRQVVASLPAVEAPADFDFRLRARIANEQHHSRRSYTTGNLSLGIPALTFAALVLLAGGFFLLPRLNKTEETVPVVASRPGQQDSATSPAKAVTATPVVPESKAGGTDAIAVRPVPKNRRQKLVAGKETFAVQRTSRLVARDSSVVGARVLKPKDSVDNAQLPLLFPLQTLRVSVDDGSGVSRTISIPTVSFGSQRVPTGEGSGLNRSTKVVW